MELNERIRELRKKHLQMSQTEFGKRLGVNRDVIGNIELNRLVHPEQKLSLLKLICKEFSINEEWLINGKEPMFAAPDKFNLHDFAKEHGITKLETEIVKTYLELEPDIRKKLIEHFKSHFLCLDANGPEWAGSTERLEEEYKKSRSTSARNTDSAALNTTDGIGKRNET